MFRSTKETDRRKAFKICLAWEGAAAKARRKELTAAQARKVIAEMVAISSGETMSFHTVRSWLNDWLTNKTGAVSERTLFRYQQVVGIFWRTWDLVLRHPLHPYRPQKSLLSETGCARKDARWPPVMRLGVC